MTNSELFTAAHKLAKTFIGNYRACFTLALSNLRNNINENNMKNQITADLESKEYFFNGKKGRFVVMNGTKPFFYENENSNNEALWTELTHNEWKVYCKLREQVGKYQDAILLKQNIFDTGYGFFAKDTKRNRDLVNRFGIDSIEMI